MSVTPTKPPLVSFEVLLSRRRAEANRSILVQVASLDSSNDLHVYCSKFGLVLRMFHYSIKEKREGKGCTDYLLVEFENEEHVQQLLRGTSHAGNTDVVVPVSSPFLWFRARGKRKRSGSEQQRGSSSLPVEADEEIDDLELTSIVHNSKDISSQMMELYKARQMSELGSRLRFFTAHQVELAFKGMFPEARALPFGSSVNGFGTCKCDLDVVLELQREEVTRDEQLVFQAKPALGNGRVQLQRHLEVMGDILQQFIPGCTQVKRILQARVPILKYWHELTGLECDLSMCNLSGVYMSELLHSFGEMDRRVRPLVFTLRRWAHNSRITNLVPGRWLTNFSLTLLVIFFLQKRSIPVLPSLNMLIQHAAPTDKRFTSDGVDATFRRDLTDFWHTENQEDLGMLLREFFAFLESFDFHNQGMSLVWADTMVKPEYSALYIQNPLEHELNVSKNVSAEEVERLQTEARNALWKVEENFDRCEEEPWGLLHLLSVPGSSQKNPKTLEISTLFEEAAPPKLKGKRSRSTIKSSRPDPHDAVPASELHSEASSHAARKRDALLQSNAGVKKSAKMKSWGRGHRNFKW